MTQTCFTVQDVCVIRQGRMIAENISFRLTAGDILTVTGANGSGKSSLLRILAGLNRSYPGHVAWQGAQINGQEETHRRRVAYLSHANGMKSMVQPQRNLELWHALLPSSSALPPMADFRWSPDIPLGFLSAGQQRRVALERVFRQTRPLWILDEPHTHLDARSIRILHEAIRRHGNEGGMSILSSQSRPPRLGGKAFDLNRCHPS